MRLTCPNCDAQYEVPDEVIPDTGRDVQCSNCGQTWFQHHPDHEPDEEEDALVLPPDISAEDEEISPPPPPQPEMPQPQRRQLDPAVADILRQEAEAEQAARRTRASETLESQPDLGLDDSGPAEREDDPRRRAREAQQRMARMRGEPAPAGDAAMNAAALGSRRDLLPDIEEINSTLRKDGDRTRPATVHGAEAEPAPRRRGGFRRGFTLMLAIAAVLALLYTYAPQIARAVPQVDPYLSSYVGQVDQARVWLDAQLRDLLVWLDSMASKSDG
jgi:predicted Zn finger-like uncharacterized protein